MQIKLTEPERKDAVKHWFDSGKEWALGERHPLSQVAAIEAFGATWGDRIDGRYAQLSASEAQVAFVEGAYSLQNDVKQGKGDWEQIGRDEAKIDPTRSGGVAFQDVWTQLSGNADNLMCNGVWRHAARSRFISAYNIATKDQFPRGPVDAVEVLEGYFEKALAEIKAIHAERSESYDQGREDSFEDIAAVWYVIGAPLWSGKEKMSGRWVAKFLDAMKLVRDTAPKLDNARDGGAYGVFWLAKALEEEDKKNEA